MIGTLILILFRLRRRGYLRSFKRPFKSARSGLTGRPRRLPSRTSTPEPQMSEARMSAAASPAERLSRVRSPSAWDYDDDDDRSASPSILERPLPVIQKSLKGLVGRGGAKPRTAERDLDGFFVGSTLSPVPEARSVMSQTTDATLVVPPSPVLQATESREPLAQQPEPAASVNCPVQKLQNKLRLHNSTDPRPCTKHPGHQAADRGSVSSVSSCTTCGGSSPRESRFSFAFLLQPPLDLFKSKRGSSDDDSRKSGWSLWFRTEDSKKDRPEQSNMQEKK